MPKYTRKPTTIEAIEFRGVHREDKELFRRLAKTRYRSAGQDNLQLLTLSGWQVAQPGDYVVFGTHDVYPVSPEVFLATYDPVIQA